MYKHMPLPLKTQQRAMGSISIISALILNWLSIINTPTEEAGLVLSLYVSPQEIKLYQKIVPWPWELSQARHDLCGYRTHPQYFLNDLNIIVHQLIPLAN